MSKEYLEALEKLLEGYSKGMSGRSYYDIIKQALQRLESIDNAKPSEALEDLDDFKNGLVNKETGMIMFNQVWFKNQIDTIKQALSKAQELEKVLNIIKEKPTDSRIAIAYLGTTINPTYEDYCLIVKIDLLPKKEFDLLKEILK